MIGKMRYSLITDVIHHKVYILPDENGYWTFEESKIVARNRLKEIGVKCKKFYDRGQSYEEYYKRHNLNSVLAVEQKLKKLKVD
jgi:hypothetical protein